MEILHKTDFDFMGKRKLAFSVSIVLSVLGVFCAVMIYTGHANMGIDFAGGASANLVFAKPVHIDQARDAMDKAGFGDAEIQAFTGDTKLLVRVKKANIPIEQVVDKIKEGFVVAFPDNPVTVDSSSAIGPTVGKALQKDALYAIILSLLVIIAYIWIRFEFKFGLAATVATLHDVLAVMGIFYLLNREFTLLVVVALLTVAGYSLTDTVVVFDRIRENLKLRQKDSLLDLINSSINEVLSRTIVVSTTGMLTVVALFLIGGEVLHDFALAMILGIAVGTYSSIFVASPLLYVWRGAGGGRLIKAAMLTKQPVKAGAAPTTPVVPSAPRAEAAANPVGQAPADRPAKAPEKKGGRAYKGLKKKAEPKE
ncbi:MAG: protein translocase subunit SecF [Nitrospirae bacterium]|nr:protein translocase subunit SecF [Nitrospirota bacterium]